MLLPRPDQSFSAINVWDSVDCGLNETRLNSTKFFGWVVRGPSQFVEIKNHLKIYNIEERSMVTSVLLKIIKKGIFFF